MSQNEFRAASEAVERWPSVIESALSCSRLAVTSMPNAKARCLPKIAAAVEELLDGVRRFAPHILEFKNALVAAATGPFDLTGGEYTATAHGGSIRLAKRFLQRVLGEVDIESIEIDHDSIDWFEKAKLLQSASRIYLTGSISVAKLGRFVAIERARVLESFARDVTSIEAETDIAKSDLKILLGDGKAAISDKTFQRWLKAQTELGEKGIVVSVRNKDVRVRVNRLKDELEMRKKLQDAKPRIAQS
mgnify:CR=1 FL=1